jgi:catechol 2,3-dioxygenase-like lactoylglutathione lyase family enzyme
MPRLTPIPLLAALLVAGAAAAQPLPGMRGLDHVGVTVPDMAEAEAFFTDVLGCAKATSFGPFRDDEGTFMADLVDVDPRAVIEQITLMRCGNGSNVELFKYTAPDQSDVLPRNSDLAGHHLAFYVDDIAAAKAYFDGAGVRTMMGPVPITEGPVAGQSILYFFAPWGLQMEAISYPDGMAYETDGGPVLWSTRDPAN